MQRGLRRGRSELRQFSQSSNRTRSSLQQLSFGVSDFVSVLSQPGLGLQAALRASSNNLEVVASRVLPGMLGPIAGVTVALGTAAAGFLALRDSSKEATDQLAKDQKRILDLRERLAKGAVAGLPPEFSAERERQRNLRKLRQQLETVQFRIGELSRRRRELVEQFRARGGEVGPGGALVPPSRQQRALEASAGPFFRGRKGPAALFDEVRKIDDEIRKSRIVDGKEVLSLEQQRLRLVAQIAEVERQIARDQKRRKRETFRDLATRVQAAIPQFPGGKFTPRAGFVAFDAKAASAIRRHQDELRRRAESVPRLELQELRLERTLRDLRRTQRESGGSNADIARELEAQTMLLKQLRAELKRAREAENILDIP